MRQCHPLGKLKMKSRVTLLAKPHRSISPVAASQLVLRTASDNALCELIGSGHALSAKLEILLCMLRSLLLALHSAL